MIPFRVFFDVHVAKQPEERDPEDEDGRVPDEEQWDTRDEGDQVEEGCDCGEGADDLSVHLDSHIRREKRRDGGGGEETNPFPICVLVLLVRGAEINAVQSTDCEREDQLDEPEDAVRDV